MKSVWIQHKYIFLLCIIALIFLFPVFHGYYISQDGEAHVARFASYYQAFSDRQFPPRWAENLNYGYGNPALLVYYPLPGYIGSLLHLFSFSFEQSYLLLIALSFITAPITCYFWVKSFLKPQYSFFVAVLYGFAPYHLLNLFVRGDVAELLAFVFLPLVFWCIDQTVSQISWKSVWWGGIVFGLLILSHNGVSLMFTPILLFYALFKIILIKKWKNILKITSLFLLGFGYASFFWIPALIEKKYLNTAVFIGDMYKQHFLSFLQLCYSPWGFGSDVNKAGGLSPQIGVIPIIIIIIIFVLWIRMKKKDWFTFFWFCIFFIGIFISTAVSSLLWSHISLLQLFEFPWRFTGLTSFSVAMIACSIVHYTKNSRVPIILSIVFLLTIVPFIAVKGYITHSNKFYSYYPGTTSYHGETTSIWTAGDPSTYSVSPVQILEGKGIVSNLIKKSNLHRFTVTMQTKGKLIDNTVYFPGWRVYVDGVFTLIQFQDTNHPGLITFPVSSGKHTVIVQFTETHDCLVADAISLLSISILLSGIIWSVVRTRLQKK